MLCPVLCFTCGSVMSSKWNKYNELVKKYKGDDDVDSFVSLSLSNVKPTAEGRALDELKIKRLCCRRTILGNIDLIDKL
jgi:DNA-directed RNA polymerases I, II, and III subunit RPABC5